MTFYVRDASDQVLSEFIKPVDSIEPPVWNRDTYYALGQVLAVSDATKIGPPVSLTAAVTATESGYLVTLTWEAPADWSGTIPNYQILRKLTWNGTSVVVGTDCEVGTDCPPNRSWSETVTAGGYWYQVRALADPGTGTAVPGALSRILKVDPGPTGPHAVASVTAEAREGSIRVLWPRSQDDLFNSTAGPLYDFQDYTVSRRVELTPGTWDLWEVLTDRTVREPYYLDPAPPTGVNLEYKVTVADTSGNSTSTTVPTSVQVATDPYRSPAPGGLFSSPGPAALEVAIGWEGVPGNGVMSYKVYKLTGTNPPEWTAQSVFYATSTGWAQNAVDPRFIPSTSTRAKLTGLAEKTPVTLAVAALDAVGESLLSTPLIVRPALDGDDPWPLEPPDGFGGIRSGRRTASFQVDASQPSHIYRRVEGAPGLYDLRNGTPAIAVGDQDLNPCKAYVYLANRAEMTVQDGVSVPTGEVSADTIPVWVKRYAAAQAPVMGMATGCEGNALKWMESFEDQCAPGVDFNTVSWKLRRVGGYDSPVTVAANLAPGATACDALADPTEAYYYWAEVKIENLKDLGIAPQYDDMPWGTVACVKNGVINPAFCNWPPVNLNGGDAPPPPPPPRPRKQKISDPTVELWLPEEYRGEETVITDASASAIMAEECSGEPTEGPASDRPAAGTTCGDPAFSKVSEDIGTAESMPVMSDATTSVDGDSWTHAEAGSTIVGDAIGVLARGPSDGFDVGLECTLNDDAIFLGTALQLASICTVGAGVGASEDSDNWEGDSTAQSLSTHTIDLSALLESDLIVVGDPPPPQVWSPAERGYRLTFLHSDHLGTTRVGTKEDGTVAFRSASLPFGERLIGQLPGTTIDDLESHSKSFAGHARDDRTDALYMRARYNSPILCRFVDPDPELAAVDRSGAWNRYPYVESSPMNRVDPTGGRWLPGTAPPRTGPGPWSIPCYACFQRGEGWTDEDWQKFSEGAAKAKESLTSETKAHFREKYKVDLDEYYTDGSGPVVDATAKIDGASGEITRGWFGDRITLDLSDLFNRDGSVNQARLEHTTLHESEHYANTPWFGREPSVKTPADVATKALEAVGKQKFFKHNNYSVIGFWAEVIQFGFIF